MSAGRNFPARARSVRSRRIAAISPIACCVCSGNHRAHHAVFHRHGDADVDFRIQADSVARPAGVHQRMFFQRARHRRDQQVGVVEPGARSRSPAAQFFARGSAAPRHRFPAHEEMRRGRPALRRPLRHQPSHLSRAVRQRQRGAAVALAATEAPAATTASTSSARISPSLPCRASRCPRHVLAPAAAPSEKSGPLTRFRGRPRRRAVPRRHALCRAHRPRRRRSARPPQRAASRPAPRSRQSSAHGNHVALAPSRPRESRRAGDSISTTALSVSISSSGSPLAMAFAFFFSPGQKLAGFLRHLERGHDDADGHEFSERRETAAQLGDSTPSVLALASTISTHALAGSGRRARAWSAAARRR